MVWAWGVDGVAAFHPNYGHLYLIDPPITPISLARDTCCCCGFCFDCTDDNHSGFRSVVREFTHATLCLF